MPLLPIPNIMTWLADFPNELAHYQAGEAPFNLGCFTQDSLRHLEQLLDHLANNDEYHRAQALNYPNKEARQTALQEMKRSLDDVDNNEARQFVTNLRADQALQAVSLYRKLSQKVQNDIEWQQQGNAIESADLMALQKYWQPLMPLAFCTSHDLIEKVALLEELDAYVWLAKYHFKQSQSLLPPALQEQYRQWFTQFSQALRKVKHAIAEVMVGIIRAMAITQDLNCDSMINTEVIPLLKQLGVLKPNTPELWLSGSLNATQFAGLVTFIQNQGSRKQQKTLTHLSLFESRADDKLPLSTVPTLSGHFILVPTALKKHFPPVAEGFLGWLSPQLRIDRRRREQFFGMERTYQMLLLNQQLRRVEQQLTVSNEHSLATQVSILQEINDAEKQLSNEIARTLTTKPRGLKAWFFRNTRQMMDVWSACLQQQRMGLITQKIALAEQMVQTMEDVLNGTRVSLTPTLFKSVQKLFKELPIQLDAFSGASASKLKNRFNKAYQHYQLAAQFSQHFLEQVQQPTTFLVTAHQVADRRVLEFDRQQVHEWTHAYSTLVSPEKAKAMRLIGQIITGESYPASRVVKRGLSPLFANQANPEKAFHQFMVNFVDHMVLPCIRRIQDPAYQFVNSFAPTAAKQWAMEHRTQLEGAIQLVQYICNVESGHEINLDGSHPPVLVQEDTVTITQEKVLQGIQHICALSTPEQDYTAHLLTAAQYYLEHGSQHVGYVGDNLTYHRIISDIALATGNDQLIATYGGRRFRHLLAQHRYEDLLQDAFLLEHSNNAKLKQLIQAELDHILAKPLGDDYSGILPVIQQWGLKTQAERYAQQRDQYYLKKFTQALSEPSAAMAIDDCLQDLKRLNEPFPQTALGHYQLQALFCETADEVWQVGKQHLVNIFGDSSSQQAYRLVWLKTFLLQPSLSQSCREDFDHRQPYTAWIAALGKNQAAAVHAVINQFLDSYDQGHPLGLEVVKNILSSEWIATHKAQDLADKLAAIEQVCQRQVQLQELAKTIQQQLTHGEYTKTANQFNFLLKQQAYCKNKNAEQYQPSQESYQAALSAITAWLRQAVFAAPTVFAWIESIILPVFPEGEAKTELTRLCQFAENSRFAYDCLYLTLRKLASNPSKNVLSNDGHYLNYLVDWPSEKQQFLVKEIETILSQLGDNHQERTRLLALQRLLQGTSTDKKGDHELLLQNSQQTASSVLHSGSYQDLQASLEQRFLSLLRSIKEGKTWELGELKQVARYYHLALQLSQTPSSSLQSMIKAVASTLEITLKRVLTHLAAPSTWLQLPQLELENHGQQVTDDCELIRTLANPKDIQLLDKALDQWLLSYCRLFVPLPPQSELPQVMYLAALYEQVLSQGGNTHHQEQVTALSQLRTGQQINELNRSCVHILQKLDLNLISKSGIQDVSFFNGMSYTLKRLATSTPPVKSSSDLENSASTTPVITSSDDRLSISYPS